MLLYFAYALDSADGQLARLLNKQSKTGEWLDHSLDAVKIPLMHGVAIILIIENKMPGKLLIIFYLTVLSLASANFLSGILKSKLIKKHITENNYIEEKNSTIRSILTLPLDYGIFALLFLFTYKSDWFILLYNIWGIVFIVYSVLLFAKSWRELAKDA